MSFTVICVYRPPSAKDVFYDHLQTILNHCKFKKEIILLDDFNVNRDIKSDRKKIKQLTDEYNLTQIIKGPTGITNTSNTTIDLIFTNKSERIFKTFNLLSGLSDHNFILCSRKIKRKHLMASTKGHQYYLIPKSQQQSLNEEIQNVDWSNILESNDIEVSSDIFIKKVNEIIMHFTKKGKSKEHRNNLPWLNNEVIKLMKNRHKSLTVPYYTVLHQFHTAVRGPTTLYSICIAPNTSVVLNSSCLKVALLSSVQSTLFLCLHL